MLFLNILKQHYVKCVDLMNHQSNAELYTISSELFDLAKWGNFEKNGFLPVGPACQRFPRFDFRRARDRC